MLILTSDEIRAVEQKCFDNYSTEADLMLKAGTACYNEIIKKYNVVDKTVSVFCGNGKNAGDGFVISRLLFAYGVDVKIVLCDKSPNIAEPLMYYNQAVDSGVEIENFNDNSTDVDFIVDCMFGIGFHGKARAPFDYIFESISNSNATVISVDTPSGTNATTGEVCQNCISADFTIAISTLKYCHILPPANSYCGDVVTVDIGIPDDCYDTGYAKMIDFDYVKSCFKKRDKNSNKGTFGHQLNICGSYKMFGAGVIATQSALRSGVGLVKLATPKCAYPLASAHMIQPIFNPLSDNTDGTFSSFACKELVDDLSWADSVVLGCGIGVNDDTRAVCEYVIKNSKCPIIIDADGINCIKSSINIFKDIKVPVVLTPHPGEMSRLISKSVAEVQADRINIAKNFARDNNVIVVLKGANTVVTDSKTVFVCPTGNPSMAMGGTGDMLSGMIGAFIAQGLSPFQATVCAVYIHGLCGDKCAKEISQRGMTVSDMIDRLGTLMSEFE